MKWKGITNSEHLSKQYMLRFNKIRTVDAKFIPNIHSPETNLLNSNATIHKYYIFFSSFFLFFFSFLFRIFFLKQKKNNNYRSHTPTLILFQTLRTYTFQHLNRSNLKLLTKIARKG